MKNWLVIIPARLKSTRLFEKPLQKILGKELILRVAENIRPLEELGAKVVIATDSHKIREVCEAAKIGLDVVMTKEEHISGSDRCLEVYEKYPHYSYILNVQGDEPFLDRSDLIKLCERLEKSHDSMGTLMIRKKSEVEFKNPNQVKIAVSENGRALYFSRASIPYARDHSGYAPEGFFAHIGVYAYTSAGLKQFCALKPSSLELMEKLEQLRALENNLSIVCVETKKETFGIDTAEDVKKAEFFLASPH